jgi:hypothetical protein
MQPSIFIESWHLREVEASERVISLYQIQLDENTKKISVLCD